MVGGAFPGDFGDEHRFDFGPLAGPGGEYVGAELGEERGEVDVVLAGGHVVVAGGDATGGVVGGEGGGFDGFGEGVGAAGVEALEGSPAGAADGAVSEVAVSVAVVEVELDDEVVFDGSACVGWWAVGMGAGGDEQIAGGWVVVVEGVEVPGELVAVGVVGGEVGDDVDAEGWPGPVVGEPVGGQPYGAVLVEVCAVGGGHGRLLVRGAVRGQGLWDGSRERSQQRSRIGSVPDVSPVAGGLWGLL